MRRAIKASLFSLGFPRSKKPLHNGSYEYRVPEKKKKLNIMLYYVWVCGCLCGCGCLYVCVIQHRNWPLRSTIFNAHGVQTGSVHAHILTKPSRAGFAVIRLELIEPGAATSV